MDTLKLLVVEDDEHELKICESSRKRYERENKRSIKIVTSMSLTDAMENLNNTFDGAIVDLKLSTVNDSYEGNEIVKEIRNSYRIPIAILTGTPQIAEFENSYLGVFTRGETEYVNLFDLFYQIYDTGLTKVFGGRGIIEQVMDDIFWHSVRPNFEEWIAYNTNEGPIEKGLLRFTVSHLLELLDVDSDIYFPEEMYITSPSLDGTMTGNIVQDKGSGEYYIVLSPACDLVIRATGKFKTDSLLVCFIEKYDSEITKSAMKKLNPEGIDGEDPQRQYTSKQKSQAKQELEKLVKNNSTYYFHYLPKTKIFSGGIINFRKVSSFKPDEFQKKFSKPVTRIAMAFTKDIVARFSSFYARQGQPDFDSKSLVKKLIEDLS